MIKANKQILSTIQFDCGDNDLNEFLLKDSFKNLENSLSKIIIYIIFIKNIIFINKCIIIPPLYLERFISLNFFNIY